MTPAGIADLEFGDPVDAINRVAAKIKAEGAADLIIVENHDGAASGTPDGATLEEEVAAGGPFAKLVNQTTPDVAAIFTGHTHKEYAWDAPVRDADGQATGKTRPIIQTGNYGENVGTVTLTVDVASTSVTGYKASIVERTTDTPESLVAAYPRVAAVKTIVDKALADAKEIGNQPVGAVTADITTAFTPDPEGGAPKRDDRASESTLGNLVADSLVDTLKAPELGAAEIGVVNPGGLRNELYYAPDGTITYAEANAVLPFVNNLWTTSLTGAQFKTLLEQQWQTNPDGTVPSRPYQQLGLSMNVNYTYDAARPAGERVTGIWVDGTPIDPAKQYRIGTFSFLATGGDNFRVFPRQQHQGHRFGGPGCVDQVPPGTQPGIARLRAPFRSCCQHNSRRRHGRRCPEPGRFQAGPDVHRQPGEQDPQGLVRRCRRHHRGVGRCSGDLRCRERQRHGTRHSSSRYRDAGAHRRRNRHHRQGPGHGGGERSESAAMHGAGQTIQVVRHCGLAPLRHQPGWNIRGA